MSQTYKEDGENSTTRVFSSHRQQPLEGGAVVLARSAMRVTNLRHVVAVQSVLGVLLHKRNAFRILPMCLWAQAPFS